jgi:hypothetical protein
MWKTVLRIYCLGKTIHSAVKKKLFFVIFSKPDNIFKWRLAIFIGSEAICFSLLFYNTGDIFTNFPIESRALKYYRACTAAELCTNGWVVYKWVVSAPLHVYIFCWDNRVVASLQFWSRTVRVSWHVSLITLERASSVSMVNYILDLEYFPTDFLVPYRLRLSELGRLFTKTIYPLTS